MLRHLPNLICVLRIVLTVPIVIAVDRGEQVLALVLFSVAAISDGLDGYLAKHNGWASEIGRILDPIADKILLVATFLACTWQGLIPVWLAIAAVARDVMLVGGAFIYRAWFGPIKGSPSVLSKVNTGLQIAVVIVAMLNAAISVIPTVIVFTLAAVTFVTTVVSGLDYARRSFVEAWAQLPAPGAR
ncbi:MAG: CDP-alcohol phosphatidyltransferase family protein [Gammaproteobacteria bacterium]